MIVEGLAIDDVIHNYTQSVWIPVFVTSLLMKKYQGHCTNQHGVNVLTNSWPFQESIEFLPNFRSPCWLQRSKTTSSRGQTRHSSSSSGGQVTLRCLPAVLLAGMPKCGTTTLFNNLAQHPDFVAQRKEPHFWTRKVHGNWLIMIQHDTITKGSTLFRFCTKDTR